MLRNLRMRSVIEKVRNSMASRESKTQKQAQQLKTLEDRLTILSGELADAEAECRKLQAERDDFATKAERLAKENGVFNEMYTHECSQRKAAQEVLQSWQAAAIILGVTSLALAIAHAF